MKPVHSFAALLLLSLGLGGFLWARSSWVGPHTREASKSQPAADLESARTLMRIGKYREALDVSREIANAGAAKMEAHLVVAECFTKLQRLDEALRTYDGILGRDEADDEHRKIAYQCAGEILLHRGDARRAEKYFREALKHDPYFPPAHNRLAFLLGLEGRRWESLPHLIELIKQDRFSVLHLLLLANSNQNIVIGDFLERVRQFDPEYPIPRIGEAREAINQGNFERAAEIIHKLVSYDPRQIEVKMLEGTLYLVRGQGEQFVRWSGSLSLQHESHPDCWLLRAQWARRNGKIETAIRCYAEAFFRDPNSLEACQALAQLLPNDEDAEVVDYFSQRTKLLDRLQENSHDIYRNQRNVRLMREAFACCDWLERYWEAWGWCRAALAVDEHLDWAKSQEADIEKHLVYDLPQTIIFQNINEWNYGKYPLPKWPTEKPAGPQGGSDRLEPAIAFREFSAEIGLDFQYESGHQGDPNDPTEGRRMYEVPGGGVAIVDFDLDLFPDVYLGQGTRNFKAPAEQPTRDRLFRNLSGERFRDVTAGSGIEELSFSHGVSAGDFNNDGFPDLYVGNLGINRLYVSNGDGTFSDATSALPRLKGVWTSSTAIADIDADGDPDLYDVNYLQEEAYERLCDNNDGYKRACNPRIFPAERDRVFLSNGDGTFADRSTTLPLEADEGRGLGILIADYFSTGQLQLFIANDMTANNFYVPDSLSGSTGFSVRDEALIRGLALDRRGRAQACMGVAFGDLDSNSTFDLFVTNFFGDYNTLYLQEQEIFSDLSHSSNLAALSYQMLGFGTQSLDADLDGDLDLFVANGHIDDFTFQGLPYRMRPQLFVNDGAGKFEELAPQEAGSYFSRELLGRGVARLDWNGDGREDIVVSHLDAPAVLLSNESHGRGTPLRLSFVGTKLSRDPTGTVIELLDGDDVRIAQVTAGSGYLASNESIVIFPVLQEAPVTIRICWPDQTKSEFAGLRSGAHYRIIEGSPRAHAMP